MAKRVVVDTSVVIAALIGEKGPAREVLRKCLLGEYQPLISNALFSECEDVASRKDIKCRFPLEETEIRALLNAYYSVCEWVSIYYLWRPNLQDEGDNHIVELGVSGRAQYLITQNIRDFSGVQLKFDDLVVVTPTNMLRGE